MIRTASRYPVRVACQVVRERDFTLVASQTLDISHRGIRVPRWSSVLTGEEFIVSLQDPITKSFIDAQCVVARVIHGRRGGERRDLHRGLGLMFTPMDSQSTQRWEGLVKRLSLVG